MRIQSRALESIYLKSFFTELAKSQTMPTELVVMHECRIIPYNRHHIRTYLAEKRKYICEYVNISTMEVYVNVIVILNVIVLVLVIVLVCIYTYCLMHIRIVLKNSSGFIILQSKPSPL